MYAVYMMRNPAPSSKNHLRPSAANSPAASGLFGLSVEQPQRCDQRAINAQVSQPSSKTMRRGTHVKHLRAASMLTFENGQVMMYLHTAAD